MQTASFRRGARPCWRTRPSSSRSPIEDDTLPGYFFRVDDDPTAAPDGHR